MIKSWKVIREEDLKSKSKGNEIKSGSKEGDLERREKVKG